ncbi:hypothetical protein [Bradyrhizobium sp. USDA 4486]
MHELRDRNVALRIGQAVLNLKAGIDYFPEHGQLSDAGRGVEIAELDAWNRMTR